MTFYLNSLEYLDTFIILSLLAISPKHRVRKTTTLAAIMGSIGTVVALSVGNVNTQNENLHLYASNLCTSHRSQPWCLVLDVYHPLDQIPPTSPKGRHYHPHFTGKEQGALRG